MAAGWGRPTPDSWSGTGVELHNSLSTRTWLEDHPRIRHAFIPVRGVLAEPEGGMVADLPQDSLAHATAPAHPSNGDRDFSGTLIRRVRPDGVRT
jgi:hypothetical protein